jgi:rhodanese-related sulfurtransferase
MKRITVTELSELMDKGDVFVLDVREEAELDFGKINGSHLIPMGQIEERMEEIPKDKKIVTYCRTDNRSSMIANLLESKGFSDVSFLEGGILEWGQIDDSIEMY